MDIQALEKHLFHTRVKLILDFTKTLHWEKDNKQPFTTLFPHVSGEYRNDESELLKLLERKVFSHCLRMDKEDHGGLSKMLTNVHNVL